MLFLDMDGVLAVYNPDDYVGNPMPFEAPGIHYFRNRPVADGAEELMTLLVGSLPPNRVMALSTLSANAATDKSLAMEHKSDKAAWLAGLCAKCGVPSMPLAFAMQNLRSKAATACGILRRRGLRPTDVLIDDFNANLADWARAGGTAVKWLNGHNDAGSWPGATLCTEQIGIAAPVIAERARAR